MPRDGDVGSVVPPIIAFSDLLKMFFFVVCMEFFSFSKLLAFLGFLCLSTGFSEQFSSVLTYFFLDVGNLIRFLLEDG